MFQHKSQSSGSTEPPQTASDRAPDDQQRLGNHEIQRRLAEDGSLGQGESLADTRQLEYNQRRARGSSRAYDPENRDGVLPFTDGGWDANQILENLTQLDNDSLTLTDGVRCQAVSTLATHVMGGPGSVIRVAANVLNEMAAQVAASSMTDIPDAIRDHFTTTIPIMPAIIGRLSGKAATYEDLRRISDVMKLVVDWDQTDGTAGEGENEKLAGLGGGVHDYLGNTYSGMRALDGLAYMLGEGWKGYAAVLGVGTNDAKVDTTNHAVNFGADPSGKLYLYDPWPRDGKQMMYLDSDRDDIQDYFVNTEGKARRWTVESLIKPA